jgi:type III secretory pathway lipoprotein EscJ
VAPGDVLDLDEERPKPTASVLLRHRGPTPPISTGDVQQLVAGAVPGLEKKAVSVVSDSVPQGQAASQRLLAQLGPVTVTRASLLPLKLMVGVALLLNVVLVGLLGMLWKRARRLEQRLQEAEGEEGRDADAAS